MFIPEKTNTSANHGNGAQHPKLDPEQKKALLVMENTDNNIFLTGKAGTGKSHLIRAFEETTRKRILKLAPTGRAARHINGATMHSTFGYEYIEYLDLDAELTFCGLSLMKPERKVALMHADTLIIDEISMVRPDQLDRIDMVLRALTGCDRPFGGKQMIAVGDLLQLPPVIVGKDLHDYLYDRYGGVLCFYSKAFQRGNFCFIELTRNHRQRDAGFYEMLNRIREGTPTEADVLSINMRYENAGEALGHAVTLFPSKGEAAALNAYMLQMLDGPEYCYDARVTQCIEGDQLPNLENNFPISEKLRLKPGALIMMVANDPGKRWVNGTIGTVESLHDDYISVLIDGRTFDVGRMVFSLQEPIYDRAAKKIEYRNILSVDQFPIILSYGMTIHKSQGSTFPAVTLEISQCRQPGQAYVALSRCTSLENLHLLSQVPQGVFECVDQDALAYLEHCRLSSL